MAVAYQSRTRVRREDMRAYPISLSPTAVTTTATATATRFLLNPSPIFNKTTTFLFLSTPCPPHRLLFSKFRHTPFCSSNSNVTSSNISEDDDDVYFEDDDDDDDDGFVLSDKKTQSLSEDGVFIEIKKLGGNSRRIRSKIGIEASLDTVWNILTDYEKLADIIPGLAVSKVVEKKDNFVRLFQVSLNFVLILVSDLNLVAACGPFFFDSVVLIFN